MSITLSRTLTERLRSVTSMVAFTGAGVSAESGVPTFRGTDGIWKKFRPEELATMEAFLRNPDLVWEWYAHRRAIIAGIAPNAGHDALARMEEIVPRFTVITQNIDNLHRRAGSRNVLELHGNIERNYCMKCGTPATEVALLKTPGAPSCIRCGGRVRPDVVWFGEMLPEDEWDASVRAAESADLFLSIGTSAVVYPAASLPLMARRAGAYLIEINPEPTPLTPQTDEFLQGPSGLIVPLLLEELRTRQGERTPRND
jgi:NAD-dependent deacetylase